MPTSKPYYRISRPFAPGYMLGNIYDSYIMDSNFCDERSNLVFAFQQITHDLIKVFDYIEPTSSNMNVYSHRIFEILLRACTEFEANSKAILRSNGFIRERYSMTEYHKLEKPCKLSEYKVVVDALGENRILIPFQEWSGTEYRPLSWYQAYNSVKHNRNTHFSEANLENAIMALAAVQVILFSQFFVCSLDRFRVTGSYNQMSSGFYSSDANPFQVSPPNSWTNDEKYAFNWDELKQSMIPVEKYPF